MYFMVQLIKDILMYLWDERFLKCRRNSRRRLLTDGTASHPMGPETVNHLIAKISLTGYYN